MVHQILHRCAGTPCHRPPGGLDEPVVTLSRAGDRLWSRFGRRFWHAGQNRFGEGVHQGIQRLLSPANAEDVPQNAIKACSNPFFSAGQFNSPIQFVPDRRPNERAGICVASGLRRLVNLVLFFSGEPDRRSGTPGCARTLLHKKASTYNGSERHFWTFFFAVILRRTSVERATYFVPRRKPLTAPSLRVKKHQTVRQTLYVPLPGLCCLFASVRAIEVVAERRDSSQTAAMLENSRDLLQTVAHLRNRTHLNKPVHWILPSPVRNLSGYPICS
jgi:hypothetical protein